MTSLKSDISLIVAMTKERVIGCDNKLPWVLPEDLKRFKRITLGKPIIMGRKTFESIGRPLPGRLNVVLSRKSSNEHPGTRLVHSLDDAFELAQEKIASHVAETQPASSEFFVIGGGEIFSMALPHATKLYITWVDAKIPGDALFPDFSLNDWILTHEEHHEENGIKYRFCDYNRKKLAS